MAMTKKERKQFDLEVARSYVNRTCAHLSLISQRATLAASGPEPEAGAEEISRGLDDLRSELRVLRSIARRRSPRAAASRA